MVIVWVALLLPVILGLTAFAVDVGVWYQQKRQLQTAADAAALAAARDLPSDPNAAAADVQLYVSKNIAGATVTLISPYNGDSRTIKVTVSKPASLFFAPVLGVGAPTITATAVAKKAPSPNPGAFVYAGSPACDAISITHGGDDFTKAVLWSNGGMIASGAQNVATQVLVGNSSCSFPSQLTPPGPTATASISSWPEPLPAVPSSCSSANITIGSASWLSSNPPGIYCTTGTISIAASGLVFDGYEFVSEFPAGNAITVTNPDTFVGYGSSKTIFYATAGTISINNPATITGEIFAPSDFGSTPSVIFTGGSSTETGFIEAWTMKFDNGPYTFVGTGPTSSDTGGVSLIG